MTDRPPQRDPAATPEGQGAAHPTPAPTEPPRYPRTEGDSVDGAESPGRPRWLTVVAIVAGVLVVLLFIALHLSGALGPGAH